MTFLRIKSQTHDTQQTHDVMGFFQAKKPIQVVSFSLCDKMANCRELVVCCIRHTNAHRVRVYAHGTAYERLCYAEKSQTHDTQQTHDVMGCNEISQSWVFQSCMSVRACMCARRVELLGPVFLRTG